MTFSGREAYPRELTNRDGVNIYQRTPEFR